jgi:hypothetical protein
MDRFKLLLTLSCVNWINVTDSIDVNIAFEHFWAEFKQLYDHKVRTYKEYHRVCPSSELGLSQPLSRQRV